MFRGSWLLPLSVFIWVSISAQAIGEIDGKVIAEAAEFHQFRLNTLKQAHHLDVQFPGQDAGAKYASSECKKFALRTSSNYLRGIVYDLIRDDSRTEEPYLLAIMILDCYPPAAARAVTKAILADADYAACTDVKNWLWEIDEAHSANSIR